VCKEELRNAFNSVKKRNNERIWRKSERERRRNRLRKRGEERWREKESEKGELTLRINRKVVMKRKKQRK
jgi:hypothetical protein